MFVERYEMIERSLITTYRSRIWSKFTKAVKIYNLIKEGDKVCVCISGGKDSMCMAKLFQQMHKYSDFPFDVEYLVMNPGYNKENFDLIKHNLEVLNIPVTFMETDIFDVANNVDKNPCYLCAKMRRGWLYHKAKELGCNKIALGHHYDDVIETTLMNMLNAGSFQTMLPKIHSKNFEGMELIRPMYLIREEDIISWSNLNELRFIQCACRFTENLVVDDKASSQRANTKKLIQELKKTYNDNIEKNIFRAGENVNLDMILGYKTKGEIYTFNDIYDEN
ncbi:MAG: tRNA 2-thiocytidine biosynthesis protein TtcA [Clostridia bacterium]|nr:tRNA 2-thiocytidine biosynthesis protein TtcA [Clostridia bacterium]